MQRTCSHILQYKNEIRGGTFPLMLKGHSGHQSVAHSSCAKAVWVCTQCIDSQNVCSFLHIPLYQEAFTNMYPDMEVSGKITIHQLVMFVFDKCSLSSKTAEITGGWISSIASTAAIGHGCRNSVLSLIQAFLCIKEFMCSKSLLQLYTKCKLKYVKVQTKMYGTSVSILPVLDC